MIVINLFNIICLLQPIFGFIAQQPVAISSLFKKSPLTTDFTAESSTKEPTRYNFEQFTNTRLRPPDESLYKTTPIVEDLSKSVSRYNEDSDKETANDERAFQNGVLKNVSKMNSFQEFDQPENSQPVKQIQKKVSHINVVIPEAKSDLKSERIDPFTSILEQIQKSLKPSDSVKSSRTNSMVHKIPIFMDFDKFLMLSPITYITNGSDLPSSDRNFAESILKNEPVYRGEPSELSLMEERLKSSIMPYRNSMFRALDLQNLLNKPRSKLSQSKSTFVDEPSIKLIRFQPDELDQQGAAKLVKIAQPSLKKIFSSGFENEPRFNKTEVEEQDLMGSNSSDPVVIPSDVYFSHSQVANARVDKEYPVDGSNERNGIKDIWKRDYDYNSRDSGLTNSGKIRNEKMNRAGEDEVVVDLIAEKPKKKHSQLKKKSKAVSNVNTKKVCGSKCTTKSTCSTTTQCPTTTSCTTKCSMPDPTPCYDDDECETPLDDTTCKPKFEVTFPCSPTTVCCGMPPTPPPCDRSDACDLECTTDNPCESKCITECNTECPTESTEEPTTCATKKKCPTTTPCPTCPSKCTTTSTCGDFSVCLEDSNDDTQQEVKSKKVKKGDKNKILVENPDDDSTLIANEENKFKQNKDEIMEYV